MPKVVKPPALVERRSVAASTRGKQQGHDCDGKKSLDHSFAFQSFLPAK